MRLRPDIAATILALASMSAAGLVPVQSFPAKTGDTDPPLPQMSERDRDKLERAEEKRRKRAAKRLKEVTCLTES